MWSSGTLVFMKFSAHHCKYWNVNFLSFLWFSFSWTVIVFALYYCWLSSNSNTCSLTLVLLIFKYHFYSPGDFTSFIQWPLLNFHLNFFCCQNLFLYGLFLICYSSSVSLVSSFSSLAFSYLSISGISFCIYNSRWFFLFFFFHDPKYMF